LAIRCLCSERNGTNAETTGGFLLPVRSVGVQGDARSYRNVMALNCRPTLAHIEKTAPALTNSRADINRVVAVCGAKAPLGSLSVFRAAITRRRLDILREADAIVRTFCRRTDFERQVWQFPVILLPVGTPEAPESIVLRPVNSLDGMTADVVLMSDARLAELTHQILAIPEIGAVFYDLTHKPPGTIEWE
jgi:GMP synthase (glutamine-hydrolysing)